MRIDLVPGAGIEPAQPLKPQDFKSCVSTNFTTRALGMLRTRNYILSINIFSRLSRSIINIEGNLKDSFVRDGSIIYVKFMYFP